MSLVLLFNNSFSNSGIFQLRSVTPQIPGVIRVTFSRAPKVVSSIGTNDALNPANYTLTGPTAAPTISGISTVGSDTTSVDLSLSAALGLGTWTLAVANIQDPTGINLTPPLSLTFSISSTGTTATVALGSQNDAAADVIRKHLNPAIKGPNVDAINAALATGDQTNVNNAASIFDQLFMSSASGIYLDRKTADFRIQKPVNVGLTDDVYRKYAIKTKNKKVVVEALLEILEVFYGPDALRANLTTAAAEPYALNDGDDLQILVDERIPVQVIFRNSDFNQIPLALASEVAAAITRALRSQGTKSYSISFIDPTQGTGKRVKMYSGSLGLGSALRVTGGKAQNALFFPTQLTAVYSQGF